MRIVLISDTHGKRPPIPEGDCLIHAGDLCHLGEFKELRAEAVWLKSLPHRYKYFLPSNHDIACENVLQNGKEKLLREFFQDHGIVYLRDSSTQVETFKVWGTPWVQENSGGSFNLPSDELFKKFQNIPKDTQILITHQPPYGILDQDNGEHLGSPELREVLRGLSQLRLHCFGHIHAASGIVESNGIVFCNAAVRLTEKPFVVDLDSSGKFKCASEPHSFSAATS